MKFTTLFLAGIIMLLTACKTRQPSYINYLQSADTSGKRLLRQEPVIQPNDLISIKVYSLSARPDITDAPYNLPEQTLAGSNSSSATAGFLVDDSGSIDYPRLGTLQVAGLTRKQLAAMIKDGLKNDLKEPTVIVRFLNYRITVLGEVRSPGSFTLPTERITILEALGLAGDVTDYGNKSVVQVAREKNGDVEVGYVDLTSKALFQSPYYRLQQNDVIFIEQNRRKTEIQDQQVVAQRIGVISTVVSLLAIIYTVIRR